MALGHKTGGRQKGARNRATADARAAAEATGILPLDYMLSVMRDANAEPKRRDAMAIAAAPYLHSKLSPVEGKQSQPETSEEHNIVVRVVSPSAGNELGDQVDCRLCRGFDGGDKSNKSAVASNAASNGAAPAAD